MAVWTDLVLPNITNIFVFLFRNRRLCHELLSFWFNITSLSLTTYGISVSWKNDLELCKLYEEYLGLVETYGLMAEIEQSNLVPE